MEAEAPDNMLSLRAPLARGITTLDRSLFTRTLNLAAATVHDPRNIAKYRKQLSKGNEMLGWERLESCRDDPVEKGKKCLLLKPTVKADVPSTWGPGVREGVSVKELSLVPFNVTLDYDYWSYLDVMGSIIPEELQDGMPTGFNTAGHVAHLNLRDKYLPYKSVIAQVILDKNHKLRTVINKTDDVGTESEFRVFPYEVLGGPDDLNVELRENNCTFAFDYSKVYWNSKLESEHTRLIKTFQPGEVVSDVMAGIGPFAVPAGKKGVFVFANDKNPESHRYLESNARRNKVTEYVRPFNLDGRDFIQQSAKLVYEASQRGDAAVIHPKVSRTQLQANGGTRPEPTRIPIPPTIAHFVMNLPASALEFTHHFRGVYHGREELFEPHTGTKLPLVHAHCFAPKRDDDVPLLEICDRIYKEIGVRLTPGDAEKPGEVSIHNVRTVAPHKDMFCASFRIPAEVAFAAPATS